MRVVIPSLEGAVSSREDGFSLLRMNEEYDSLERALYEGDSFRTVEINILKPIFLDTMIGQMGHPYSIWSSTSSNESSDYTYTYDAVGNVQVVYRTSGTVGQEAYFFAEDAFGMNSPVDSTTPASNRTNLLGGAYWSTARTAGITEHQAGKIQSSFTGLYYCASRWYDPVLGRFVGRSDLPITIEKTYVYCGNNPVY